MFDLIVQGYRYNDVSFGFVGPLMGNDEDGDQKGPEPTKIDGLMLREHGLAGGEIQLYLAPSNRVAQDPGYWYAAKCDHDATSSKRVVGTIWLRRMDANDTMVDDMSCPLEELDRGHLLDRLVSEVLNWHAATCGPGPFDEKAPKKSRRRTP